MKKCLITLVLFLVTFALANDLPAYVAQFDHELAIELYKKDIQAGNDHDENYSALARLYDQTGKVGLAEDCYRHLIEIKADEESYRSYIDFLYHNEFYSELRHTIKVRDLAYDWSDFIYAQSYFKEGKFDSSLVFAQGLAPDMGEKLVRYSMKGTELKYRSPALGGIMSVFIPGSGKVYAGRFLDGMQAFTVVLAPAYNAYYHFAKNGTRSVQGWIWAAVASYFYLSDIYGSVKAVREYNEMLKLNLIERYAP